MILPQTLAGATFFRRRSAQAEIFGELILQDTGLGYVRSNNVVLLSVVSRPRGSEQKQTFYRELAKKLKEECGLLEDDLIINFVENTDADWSFGRGNAEFLSGALH